MWLSEKDSLINSLKESKFFSLALKFFVGPIEPSLATMLFHQ